MIAFLYVISLILEITSRRRHHHYFMNKKQRFREGKWFTVTRSGEREVDRTSAEGCTGGGLMVSWVDGFLNTGQQHLSSQTSNSEAQDFPCRLLKRIYTENCFPERSFAPHLCKFQVLCSVKMNPAIHTRVTFKARTQHASKIPLKINGYKLGNRFPGTCGCFPWWWAPEGSHGCQNAQRTWDRLNVPLNVTDLLVSVTLMPLPDNGSPEPLLCSGEGRVWPCGSGHFSTLMCWAWWLVYKPPIHSVY